ncbi:MAG: hypothetical protein KDC98_10005 [Planctomycetes bacterium]|nr:hypothetical protein [Planctomycetota bacterium]
MPRAPSPSGEPALPPDLVDLVVARVLTVAGDERASALELLAAAHPEHAAALRAMVAEVGRTERLLDDGFAAEPAPPQAIGGYRIEHELGRGPWHRCPVVGRDHG